jgi:hypothetical protein
VTARHLFAACLHPDKQEGKIMEVSVHYLGETKFEVAARGHRVICDQPIGNGGADEGMSPPEFLWHRSQHARVTMRRNT